MPSRRPPAVRRCLAICLMVLCVLVLSSCASSKKENDVQGDTALYQDGLDALEQGRYSAAIEFFDKVNAEFPYSRLVAQSVLMSAYAHYLSRDYEGAVLKIDLYRQVYPASEYLDYALYLRALSLYQQIEGPSHDQGKTFEANEALALLIERYPDSAYAHDAIPRRAVALSSLAAHEMEVGRFYQNQRFYMAAIGRFQHVVRQYQQTEQTPEALYRLIECYLSLGINDEARVTGSVLGYNFPASDWYQKALKLLASRGIMPQEGGSLPEQTGR